MPALVGVIQVLTVANAAVFNVGDVYKIIPLSTSKSFAGAGSFNTGERIVVDNNYSSVVANDSDAFDQPMVLNV